MPTNTKKKNFAQYDINYVRLAAATRWPTILSSLGGIDPDLLDGEHHPCPKCGGSNRFRFTNLHDGGSCLCNQCFKSGNGDGFATLQWITGKKFGEVLKLVAEQMGIEPTQEVTKQKSPKQLRPQPDEKLVFEEWDDDNDMLCRVWAIWKQPIALEAVKAVGGRIARYAKQYTVIAIPVWGPELDAAKPIGYCMYNISGGTLPKYSKNKATDHWEITEWLKIKLTIGSESGIIADLSRLATATTTIKCEGVSDILTLLSLPDLPADAAPITNSCGAKEHPSEWMLELIAGPAETPRESAWVVHDADRPGQDGSLGWFDDSQQKHRPGWATQLAPLIPTKNIVLPFPIEETHGKDLRDFFSKPAALFSDLQALAATAETMPTDKPVAEITKKERAVRPESVIYNAIIDYEESDSGKETKVTVPLTMTEVKVLIREATNDFPRRTGSSLFIHDPKLGISWLDKSAAMFGWLAAVAGVIDWKQCAGAVTKDELFHELRRSSRDYAAVEVLPHEPMRADHYYACPSVEPGDGEHLQLLLDQFNPETEIDRDLIQAMLATLLWGGAGGLRPVFVITTNDGPGAGKTTLVRMAALIFDGYLSFDRGEEVADIKTRLLSADALTKRIALIDNIKTTKWSWGEFEGLITSSTISGHRMYMGEGSRPNTITWCLTLNGANLSTDMGQRSVVIRIKKPTNSGDWEDATRKFIENNRMKIIADLVGMLRSEPHRFEKFTRWGDWEASVLARVPNAAVAQAAIADRQGQVDAEQEEHELLEEYFAGKLQQLGYDTERQRIFLPTIVVAEWAKSRCKRKMFSHISQPKTSTVGQRR